MEMPMKTQLREELSMVSILILKAQMDCFATGFDTVVGIHHRKETVITESSSKGG